MITAHRQQAKRTLLPAQSADVFRSSWLHNISHYLIELKLGSGNLQCSTHQRERPPRGPGHHAALPDNAAAVALVAAEGALVHVPRRAVDPQVPVPINPVALRRAMGKERGGGLADPGKAPLPSSSCVFPRGSRTATCLYVMRCADGGIYNPFHFCGPERCAHHRLLIGSLPLFLYRRWELFRTGTSPPPLLTETREP